MSIHTRRLKYIVLTLGDSPDEQTFECQVSNWAINNNTDDGDKLFSFCYDPVNPNAGETREEVEPDYSLHLDLFADWRRSVAGQGFSTWQWQHDGQIMAFRLDNHPDIAGEHVAWTGTLKVKAGSAGGDARTTEMQAVDWPIIGIPDFLDPNETS